MRWASSSLCRNAPSWSPSATARSCTIRCSPALAFADEHKLPLLILVFNNAKDAAMQYYHDKFYPSGTAIAAKDYYGVDLKGVKYEQAAATVDGYSSRVETPAELKAALGEALGCLASGKSAIINMIMPAKVR